MKNEERLISNESMKRRQIRPLMNSIALYLRQRVCVAYIKLKIMRRTMTSYERALCKIRTIITRTVMTRTRDCDFKRVEIRKKREGTRNRRPQIKQKRTEIARINR